MDDDDDEGGLELEQQGSMALRPADDSGSGGMCLGNPPPYRGFVLNLAFTLCFPGGETWTDELGQMEDERCVCKSTCRAGGKHKGGLT